MPNLVSRASLRPAWEVLRSPSSPSSFWEPRARRAWLAPCFVGAAVFAPGAAACVAAVVFTFSAAFFSAAFTDTCRFKPFTVTLPVRMRRARAIPFSGSRVKTAPLKP
jgi:hypothetical protein